MTAQVFVPGVPVPQGSARAFVVGKRAIVTGANPKTNPWRADVAAGVRSAIGEQIVHPNGAVAVELRFVMPRRKSEPKRITPAHTRKPDLDKLARALLDAITGLVFTDDSQVSELLATKRTAAIGEQPGVLIRWAPVDPRRALLVLGRPAEVAHA